MSPFPLGALSNRETEFRTQTVLVIDEHNRPRFTPFIRSDQTLPHEILAEIFWHCLRRRDIGVTYQVPNPTAAPLSLCCICRRWREVAISTPTLWSSLFLDIAVEDGQFGILPNVALEGARHPLTICIQHRMKQHGPLEPIMSLLKTIVGLSCQWQNIDLDIEEDLYYTVFPLAPGNVPLLENLYITHRGDLSLSHREAPKLREFSIYVHSEQIRVPWHQLTVCRSDDIEISSCLDILRDCPNLSQGSFIVRGNPSTLPTSILHHRYLQSLALGAIFEDDESTAYNPMPILSCLKIHGLESFTMGFPGDSPTADISPFISFLSRSSAHLHTLGLSYLPATKIDLIQCLKFPPQIGAAPHNLPRIDIFLPLATSARNSVDPRRNAQLEVERGRNYSAEIFSTGAFKAVSSDPEFQRLEAEGMDLYIGPKQSMDYGCFVKGMY
ncbi:hypothetical protein DFH06DRAFT_1119051 [Mycena polygramma]|nr:hypothetical protein DFH06DRAFT_1119051 [Mycena polygramma]